MLNENDAIKRKLRWAIDVAGVTRDAMQTSTGVRSKSGVSEWLRTGRIAKKHLPILAQLTATSDRWWLTPDAPIPPAGDWLTARADQSRGTAPATPPESRPTPILLTDNPDWPSVRRVRFKLSAGASGFAVDYPDDDDAPIVFRREWFESRGFDPAKLLAVRVLNGSMEPGIYDGDTVVINTADTTPKDGAVFAANYEGELVVKRLVRDAGQWWLASDHPDQRRYPRKVCDERVFLLGRIVHKQSEHI